MSCTLKWIGLEAQVVGWHWLWHVCLPHIQSWNRLFQPPSLRFVCNVILLNLVVCVSFTDSVNGYITLVSPFKLLFRSSCWSFVKPFRRLRLLFVPPVVADPQSALSSSHLFCTSVTWRPQFARLLFVCVLSATGKKCGKNRTFPQSNTIITIYFGCSLWRWWLFLKSKEATSRHKKHVMNIFIIIALTLNVSKKRVPPSRSCVPHKFYCIAFPPFLSHVLWLLKSLGRRTADPRGEMSPLKVSHDNNLTSVSNMWCPFLVGDNNSRHTHKLWEHLGASCGRSGCNQSMTQWGDFFFSSCESKSFKQKKSQVTAVTHSLVSNLDDFVDRQLVL